MDRSIDLAVQHICTMDPDIKQIGHNVVKSKNAQRGAMRKRAAKRGQKTRRNRPQDQIKDHTGNEVEWDAMKQSAQFPFCQRRTIFLSQVCLLDCHWGDGLRPWLTCLSRPLACWPSKTILVIVPCSLCLCLNLSGGSRVWIPDSWAPGGSWDWFYGVIWCCAAIFITAFTLAPAVTID